MNILVPQGDISTLPGMLASKIKPKPTPSRTYPAPITSPPLTLHPSLASPQHASARQSGLNLAAVSVHCYGLDGESCLISSIRRSWSNDLVDGNARHLDDGRVAEIHETVTRDPCLIFSLSIVSQLPPSSDTARAQEMERAHLTPPWLTEPAGPQSEFALQKSDAVKSRSRTQVISVTTIFSVHSNPTVVDGVRLWGNGRNAATQAQSEGVASPARLSLPPEGYRSPDLDPMIKIRQQTYNSE